MPELSENGRKLVADIAAKHGVSDDAASQLLSAIAAGGGGQAQFNHPDLGGMGQWSRGGMTMIGDMFNSALKARVAALADDLAAALQDTSPFVAGDNGSSGGRWPAALGAPAASGSQNDMHYAIFPATRRLAIERRGHVTVYDTGDHRIGGISQRQAGDQSLRFTSQSGAVDLADLTIVDPMEENGDQPAETPPQKTDGPSAPTGSGDDEIFSRLERLADLRSRDIISAEEFAAKKAELLSRL